MNNNQDATVTTTVNEPAERFRRWIGETGIEGEAELFDAALAAERAIGAEALDVERLHRAVCLSGWVGRGQMDAWHRGPEGEWPCQDILARLTRERNGQ